MLLLLGAVSIIGIALMEHISHQIKNNVALITLDRPKKRNALNRAMISEIYRIFTALASDAEVTSVTIFGNGRDFCAGADLTEMTGRTSEIKQSDIERANILMDYIENFPKPVTAVIHGHALGGGLELALACHTRVSDGSGIFGLPEITLGFLPTWGGQKRLPKLIGDELAWQMIQTGICIDAAQAERWGLASRQSGTSGNIF
jgi:enoyl-CoA hydratase